MKMKDCQSATWSKLLELPTRAKTTAGLIKAVRDRTDFFAEMSDEEAEDFIDSEWCTLCDDGIVIWVDGH